MRWSSHSHNRVEDPHCLASLPLGCQIPETEYDAGLGQLEKHLRANAQAQADSSRNKGRARCKAVVKPRAPCTSRSPMSLATGTEEDCTYLVANNVHIR